MAIPSCDKAQAVNPQAAGTGRAYDHLAMTEDEIIDGIFRIIDAQLGHCSVT